MWTWVFTTLVPFFQLHLTTVLIVDFMDHKPKWGDSTQNRRTLLVCIRRRWPKNNKLKFFGETNSKKQVLSANSKSGQKYLTNAWKKQTIYAGILFLFFALQRNARRRLEINWFYSQVDLRCTLNDGHVWGTLADYKNFNWNPKQLIWVFKIFWDLRHQFIRPTYCKYRHTYF